MSDEAYHNMTAEQMSFAVFCIGAVAERLRMREEVLFNLFERTGVLKTILLTYTMSCTHKVRNI